MGVDDSMEGRFELFTLHVALLLERLKGQGESAAEVSQETFNAYTHGLDDAFREIGVSDTAVGKKMKKLVGAAYGRLKAFDQAASALPDRTVLSAALARTVFEERGVGDLAALTDYVVAARDRLAALPLETLLQGEAQWPKA
jgi:cytochrome b pre-mRNA-processing protein 3